MHHKLQQLLIRVYQQVYFYLIRKTDPLHVVPPPSEGYWSREAKTRFTGSELKMSELVERRQGTEGLNSILPTRNELFITGHEYIHKVLSTVVLSFTRVFMWLAQNIADLPHSNRECNKTAGLTHLRHPEARTARTQGLELSPASKSAIAPPPVSE